MKKLLLLGIVPMLIMIHACKSSRLASNLHPPPPDSTESVSTTITDLILRDTIQLPADTSAWMRMLFECDSDGNVKIEEIYNQLGERSRIMYKLYEEQDSLLDLEKKKRKVVTVRCQCDSASIYAEFRLRDTTVNRVLRITKNYPVPVPVELTWWEKFKIEYGGYAFGVIAAALLLLLIRIAIWAFATFTPQGAAVSAGTGILSTVFKLFRR